MQIYLSYESLSTWADSRILDEGQRLFEQGAVDRGQLDEEMIEATISAQGRPVRTRFRISKDGHVESHCPCRARQVSGLICSHVIAAGYWVADLTEDPVVERRRRIATRQKKPRHLNGYIQRLAAGSKGAHSARLRFRVSDQWKKEWGDDELSLTVQVQYLDDRFRLDKVSPRIPLCFNEHETQLLYVIEDLAPAASSPGQMTLSREAFLEFLRELAPGELAVLNQEHPLEVNPEPHLPVLRVVLDPGTGALQLCQDLDGDIDDYLTGKRAGWVLSGQTLRPLDATLPEHLRGAYASGGALIPREQVLSFLREDLPLLETSFLLEQQIDETAFEFRDGDPDFEVEVSGTPERLVVHLWALYGESRIQVAGSPSEITCFPVPGDPLAFFRQNRTAEKEARAKLKEEVPSLVHGADAVMKVLADTVPTLRRKGWQVVIRGLLEQVADGGGWVRPVVTLTPGKEAGWFEVVFSYKDDTGTVLDSEAVENTLDAKGFMLPVGDRTLLLDPTLFDTLQQLRDECMPDGDRVSDVYAGTLSKALEDFEEITVEANEDWWTRAKQQTEKVEIQPVEVGDRLKRILRPYQQEGINWLRFLETGGYGGILADEMGLGKTLQALAWIQLERCSASARGLPALVVCPTSLVENWAREAAKFTPDLSCLVVAGPKRHALWDALPKHDLVITSYALLRRDIARYQDQQFAVAVLDEAQHIKNRSSQNALGAKKIRAFHRLVVTGTPMENSVSDMWSILDFLMPGYLGSAALFREAIEKPIAKGGEAAEEALRKLRYKVEPFMLRRLKTQVAKDLPEKISRIATCVLNREQAIRYRTLAEQCHNKLSSLVDAKGFNQSRFTVLKTLLRLRQLCCHPALLKEEGADPTASSGKLELFFELLAEAMDGNNRVLVFSQFVEMLHILRDQLKARSIPFAYLDGATRERQVEIDRFNEDPEIPVFLVSLKAGGTGLNLTGANVVIHFDPWWNPAVEDQATDRVHRIGQTRSVYSIKLITRDTIEEKVIALQERKRQLIDATVGGESNLIKSLSWDDVQELLAL